jgi:SAM-dependent methyltransferase
VAFYPSQLPAPIRRAFWAVAYQLLARTWQRADWRLMNYGWAPDPADEAPLLTLATDDEPDRTCIQLYHHVASQRPIEGKRVLEVGSGRGGGASYVHRYLKPATTLGVDRSAAAVRLANQRMRTDGLSYAVGDAEALPFPHASFDVVLNVESCHCYGSVPAFLAEVKRVLAPGGYLLLADLRLAERVPQLDAEIAASGFVVESRDDITAGVVRGLRQDSPRRARMIRESAWPGLGRLLAAFAATEGTATFRDLDNGTFRYLRYALRSP